MRAKCKYHINGALTMTMLLSGPLFAQSGERVLELETTIHASLPSVWAAWTTAEGITAFGPEAASIELKIGGKYEWYFSMDAPPGLRGAEGCTVLAYVPQEMLAFTWNAPPSIPSLREAEARTQVIVRLSPRDDHEVVVTLTQRGYGSGEDWDQYYEYFSKAWRRVLQRLKAHLESKREPSSHVVAQAKPARDFADRNVRVLVYDDPQKWQDFHVELPVSVDEAWRFLASSEGLSELFGGNAKVELIPGGTYAIWPDAEQKILTHRPGHMLAGTGSAPPPFPNVRKGGTWFVYRFEPVGRRRSLLKMSLLGWHEHEGDEWNRAFDYFIKNNAVFLNGVRDKLDDIVADRALNTNRIVTSEAIVDAARGEVWRAFTTRQGIESWMVPLAEVDVRLGGTIKTNYNAQAGIGGPGTIVHHILSLDPERMIAMQFDAPKNAPKAKIAEATWWIVYLDDVGDDQTHVTVRQCGWGTGGAWDEARTFFQGGNDWALEQLRKRYAKDGSSNRQVAG